MRTAPLLLTGLLALSLSAPALAHKDHSHGHSHEKKAHSHDHDHKHDHGSDSLGAHQHGVSQLNVVVDGNSVEIELDSPADNLVGFEYIPTREEDLAKVRAVREQMQDPSNLFRFPEAAQCSLQQTELKSPLFDALEGAKAMTGHKHDHKHDHKHKHEHKDGGHKHTEGAHSDIEAHYSFQCVNPGALNQIEVVLFEHFPGTERIVLQAIGDAGQQGGELTRAQNIIRF